MATKKEKQLKAETYKSRLKLINQFNFLPENLTGRKPVKLYEQTTDRDRYSQWTTVAMDEILLFVLCFAYIHHGRAHRHRNQFSHTLGM